jgi:DNA polymerase phi
MDAQREATHFKNRVLDLVDTFVKKEPTSAHIIRLLLPLVELSTDTSSDERHLTDKAKGILRSRIAKSKEVPTKVDVEDVKAALSELHTRARRVHSPELLTTLSQCSLYVAKILTEAGGQKVVLSTYRESLDDFATRKNSALNTSFFLDVIRRYPALMWDMRDDVVAVSRKAVNGYRRCQCLQLVQSVVTHLPSLVSLESSQVYVFTD